MVVSDVDEIVGAATGVAQIDKVADSPPNQPTGFLSSHGREAGLGPSGKSGVCREQEQADGKSDGVAAKPRLPAPYRK